ncbi:hypothetical protein Bca101_035771 [Brassica carinata]
MSSPQKLTREQKGKEVALGRGSSEGPEDIHHEAMMDTGSMNLAQRLLVSEAREQFRGDDDGQEAVDVSCVPISYYPGNIFGEESPLESWRVRPSVVNGQDWPNVEKTKSTVESVEAILRDLTAHGDWIWDSLPHVNRSMTKRLSLFTRAEQKEVNRARSMKQLPDLSLIVAGKLGTKRGGYGSKVGPSGPETTDVVPVTAEQAPTGGSSQGKNSKKKKKNTEARKESNEVEQTDVDDSSKKGGKKRKAGDPPAEDAPKKKKMKKKDSSLPRPSSVCEEELQALVPDATPEAGTSDDDENETIALRRRRREDRTTEGGSRGVSTGDRGISEVPRKFPASEGQQGRLMGDSSAHITEGSETRVSGHPKETPEDGFKFEFNRELPLVCYPEDCARLLQLVKGGPDQLPPVGDLLFKDEYEHAACSFVKSQGDWSVLVEKYDTALRRTREQVREGEEARKKTEEALRIALWDKSDAITREKALRKAFDETRTSDAVELQMCKDSMKNLELVLDKLAKEKAELEKARAAESLKYEEEMNRLHKSRRYEVTHERIRVMIAMIAKAEKRFHQISLCEVRRDKYEEARCLQGQAFGTRRCLERIKDAGTEILQEIIETYAGQEEHYEREAARLEVKEIPEEDLRLCPLVLESRFLIDEIWRQIDPFGSNFYLIDSEAAIALRTPRADRDPPSEDQMKEPAQTAGSSTQRADQDADLTKQMSIDSVIPKDGAVPTIVLTDSPAKASENLSSSTSSSEELEKEDGVSAGRPEGVSTVNEDPPILTFGRISGPGEKDGAVSKDPPAIDG